MARMTITSKRLDHDRPPNRIATIGPSEKTAEKRWQAARKHFIEADPADFDILRIGLGGRERWVDRGSGREYVRVEADVLSEPDPKVTRVELVARLGRHVIFLRPRGAKSVETTRLFSMSAIRKAEPGEKIPGTIIAPPGVDPIWPTT